MKFTDFDKFFEESQALFLSRPDHTRYTIKYRPGDQALVLKVTDDIKTFTFETESHPVAKRADELSAAMMKLMAAPQLDPASVKQALAATSETPAALAPEPAQKQQQKKKGKRA